MPDPGAADALPLLSNYQSFWNLPDEARQSRYRVDYEALVLFHDPDWSILWLENNGEPFFLRTGGTRWMLQSGDVVRVQGVVFPPRGYEVDGLKLTVEGSADLPPPLPFDPRGEIGRYVDRIARLRGFVESSTEIDGNHLRLQLVAEGLAIEATVLLTPGEPIPQLAGAEVEVVGLLNLQRDAAGQVQMIQLWTNGLRDVTVVGSLASDPRFARPALTTHELLEVGPAAAVRFVGQVRRAVPGRSLTLGDDTGEIEVHSGQRQPVSAGTLVEAVGAFEVRGTSLHLRHALWRVSGAAPEAEPLLKYRRASQVLELAPAEAARGHPVDLVGVVTWSSLEARHFYIQDSTRGVCVRAGELWTAHVPPIGSPVRVIGRTAMGPFAPLVEFLRQDAAVGFSLPEPRTMSVDQVRGGAEEGKLVALRGNLRAIRREGPWTVLSLTSPTGEFTARLDGAEGLEQLVGSVMNVRGVCTAIANERRQFVGIELLVDRATGLDVLEPAPADLFGAPVVALSGLRRFGPLQTPFRRIRTTGTVSFQDPGRFVLLEDGGDSLEALARSTELLPIGARVEVVGFPGFEGGRLVLREAVFRAAGGAAAPAPLAIAAALRAEWHNRLVRLGGRLIGSVRVDQSRHLTLQAGPLTFTAIAPEADPLAALPEGAELRLDGVYRAEFDEYGQQRAFHLLLRTPADVVVVRAPAWLNRGRLLVLAAVLTLVGGGAFGWSVALRRRVRAQTVQIRRQLEQQGALERELERAAKLESLGLLAGGIAHDFNNLLTVILGNLTLARLEPAVEAAAGDCLEDAERGAQRARDLTQQLLTFAKGGDPHRTAVSLPEVVREAAEFVLRGSTVSASFDFAPGLWAAEVDRGQVGQVVHNLVLNAIQAMPAGGEVRLTLANVVLDDTASLPLAPGRYLELTVADTGPGMAPSVQARIFDPYFTTKKAGNGLGLATVHSIVRRHKGHITVSSVEGRGTTFHLWLPASAGAVEPTATTVHHALPAVGAGKRVLVMDDESDIRKLVTLLLQRMGLEVVASGDGAEAVAAFRRAQEEGRAFDLVIMDLTVPGGMGGKDAMQALVAIDPGVRAIVSSGYSSDPVLADYHAFGFRGMVRKPYNIEELAGCVARVLADEQRPASVVSHK